MALLRSEVPSPRSKKEAVRVESLGGEVIVHALGLADKLRFASWQGERFAQLCEALAVAVRDANGEPLWTSEQWDAWGGQHLEDALLLWNVVERLSSMGVEEAEKNLQTPSSDSP